MLQQIHPCGKREARHQDQRQDDDRLQQAAEGDAVDERFDGDRRRQAQ